MAESPARAGPYELLYLDAEGAEKAALLGAAKVLADAPLVIVQLYADPPAGAATPWPAVVEHLSALGYCLRDVAEVVHHRNALVKVGAVFVHRTKGLPGMDLEAGCRDPSHLSTAGLSPDAPPKKVIPPLLGHPSPMTLCLWGARRALCDK